MFQQGRLKATNSEQQNKQNNYYQRFSINNNNTSSSYLNPNKSSKTINSTLSLI